MAKQKQDRNDSPKGLARVGGANGGDAPDWLAQVEGGVTEDATMMEEMKEYRILPRMKAVQGQSAQELKAQFGEYSIILHPGAMLVMKQGDKMDFVPVFFFREFCVWSDRKDKASQTILDRTYDPNSDIARRARDPNRRKEPYGTPDPKNKGALPFVKRYVEHLNFPGFIYQEDHKLRGVPITLSFSKGDFKKGKAFINAVMLRKVGANNVPLWAQVWTLVADTETNAEGTWGRINFENPAEGKSPYITKDEVAFYQTQHNELKKLHADRVLQVDHTGDDEEPTGPDVDL